MNEAARVLKALSDRCPYCKHQWSPPPVPEGKTLLAHVCPECNQAYNPYDEPEVERCVGCAHEKGSHTDSGRCYTQRNHPWGGDCRCGGFREGEIK